MPLAIYLSHFYPLFGNIQSLLNKHDLLGKYAEQSFVVLAAVSIKHEFLPLS